MSKARQDITWKSKVRRYLRNRSRKLEKDQRGWRGLVFNRGFVAMVILFGMGLYEEPGLAVWIVAVLIAGIAVAMVIRASHAD